MKLYDLTTKSHHTFRWVGENVRGYRRTLSQHHAEVFAACVDIVRDLHLETIVNWQWLSIHAMFHDISEVFTGDIPYPMKKEFPELKAISDKFEDALDRKVGLCAPENLSKRDTITVNMIVKVADMIAVFKELVEYQDKNVLDIMETMATNVWKRFRKQIDESDELLVAMQRMLEEYVERIFKEEHDKRYEQITFTRD